MSPFAAALLLLAAGPSPSRVIAVFPISAVDVLDRDTLGALRSTLEVDLVEAGRFSVVAKADLKRAMGERKRESFDDCFDEACQIEIGREVAAQEILTPQVTRLGEDCEVSLKLYDLRRAATNEASSATDDCTAAGVRRALRAAAYRLAGVTVEKENVTIKFDAVDLPVVARPTAARFEPRAGLDLDTVDVKALEALAYTTYYDATDEGRTEFVQLAKAEKNCSNETRCGRWLCRRAASHAPVTSPSAAVGRNFVFRCRRLARRSSPRRMRTSRATAK